MVFLVAAVLRILFKVSLSRLLTLMYVVLFLVALATPSEFLAVAFDSGGVTTGPMTVPFIMALGIGLSSSRSDKDSANDSFGLIALSSIGPILMVLLLGNFLPSNRCGLYIRHNPRCGNNKGRAGSVHPCISTIHKRGSHQYATNTCRFHAVSN